MHVDVHLELSLSVGTPFHRHENNHHERSEVLMKLCEHSDVPMKHQYGHSDVPMNSHNRSGDYVTLHCECLEMS